MLELKRIAGDRAIPSCSNCSKASRIQRCTYPGIKVRQSSYSVKANSAQVRNARDASASPHSENSESCLFSSPQTANSPYYALNGVLVAPASDTPSRTRSFEAQAPPTFSTGVAAREDHSSPLSTTGEATSIQPGRGLGASYFEAGHSQPSERPRTSSQGSILSATQKVQQQRRLIVESTEAEVYDFYIKHAGPWVCVSSLIALTGFSPAREKRARLLD